MARSYGKDDDEMTTITDLRTETLRSKADAEKMEKWKREKIRRSTVVRISQRELDSIPRYDSTDPTGVFFHKIFVRDTSWGHNYHAKRLGLEKIPAHFVIYEMCLGPYGELSKQITYNMYEIEIDNTVPIGTVSSDMIGDYGLTYRQFVNKVYEGVYAK